MSAAVPRRGAGRSLYWPIAGAILFTVVLGTLAQVFVAAAILGPLETREARTRAELALSRAENHLLALPADADPRAIRRALARGRSGLELRRVTLVFRAADGTLYTEPSRGRRRGGPPPDRVRQAPRRPEDRYQVLARRTVERDGAVRGELSAIRPARAGG